MEPAFEIGDLGYVIFYVDEEKKLCVPIIKSGAIDHNRALYVFMREFRIAGISYAFTGIKYEYFFDLRNPYYDSGNGDPDDLSNEWIYGDYCDARKEFMKLCEAMKINKEEKNNETKDNLQ